MMEGQQQQAGRQTDTAGDEQQPHEAKLKECGGGNVGSSLARLPDLLAFSDPLAGQGGGRDVEEGGT